MYMPILTEKVIDRIGLLISLLLLLLLLLSDLSCVILAGAAFIGNAAIVSITSGSDFSGNEAGTDGGMYGCDDHTNNTHFDKN